MLPPNPAVNATAVVGIPTQVIVQKAKPVFGDTITAASNNTAARIPLTAVGAAQVFKSSSSTTKSSKNDASQVPGHGCSMAALLDHEGPQASRLLEQVPGWFEEWEQVLSRFRLDSD